MTSDLTVPIDQSSLELELRETMALHQAGRLSEAESHYLSILQRSPQHPKANHNLGALYVQMQQPAVALPFFVAALEADPAHGQYWLSYIDALHQAGRNDEARQVLAMARQGGLQGEEIDTLESSLKGGSKLQVNLQHESKPATDEINALVALFTQGRYEQVVALATSMTQRFPQHGFGWKVLGAALKQLGMNVEAEQPMRKAVELLPGDVDACSNLGGNLKDLGRLDEAVILLGRALELKPDSYDALFNLGLTWQELGRLAEAEQCYTKAIRLRPDSAGAYGNLGSILQIGGRLAEAEQNYRRALQLQPDLAAVHGYLGIVLHQQGKLDEALFHFRERARLAPGNPEDQHFIALLTGQTTERAPQKYVEGVFDNYASNFDTHLQQKLHYDVPSKLAALLARYAPATGKLEVLDLGCGTGLMGVALAPFAQRLVGVDLSGKMLEQARGRKLYQRLVQADLVSMMQAEPTASYDVIVAADVFVYMGKLDEVMGEAKRLLRPGGIFMFSVEDCDVSPNGGVPDYQLKTSGRYGQSRAYLDKLAAAPGFKIEVIESIQIRTEREQPIMGYISLWQAPAGADSATVPADAAQLLQLAVAMHQAGDTQGAERAYREILRVQPHHPEANHNLGALSVQSGRPADSLAHFATALEADPSRGQYWLSYIDGLHLAGQTEAAREVLSMAREGGLQGDDVEALAAQLESGAAPQSSGGATAAAPSPQEIEAMVALLSQGRHAEAEALARAMTGNFPQHWAGWKMLGVLLNQAGRDAEALVPMQQAALLLPDDPEAHNNLGITLQHLGRVDEAEESYRRALRLNPDFAQAHSNLGSVLQGRGKLVEAEASYRAALRLKPDYVKALSNLGALLHDIGRLDEAEACNRRALEINPQSVEALNNLGALLHDLWRLDEAEASYRRALTLNPANAHTFNNLGALLETRGELDEARASYRRAWELGETGARIKEAFMLPAIMGTRQEMLASRVEFERKLDALIADNVTIDDPLKDFGEAKFYLAYQGMNDRELQIKAARFYEQACPSLRYTAPHCLMPRDAGQKKIRLGFFSKFLYTHSISLCFGKVIEALSAREDFEVTLISTQAADAAIYAGFAGKHVCVPNSLARARAMLAALELDVVVYLDIGMEPMSYFLAFARLARTQCVLAGHPVTTGVANVDYFVSSALMEPTDGDQHYSEKLLRLPQPLVYFERPALPARLKTRRELGLPEAGRIYMCPMKLQKLHPDFDEALVRVLQLDADGTVVLFEDAKRPHWKQALLRRFERTIHAELRDRMLFLPWMNSKDDLIGAVAAADVVLDPLHFGIGSTAIVIALTGTPMVTLPGAFMRGRVGAFYCGLLGVPECIVGDVEAYARKAVGIAGDPQQREAIKARILKNNAALYENTQPIEDFAGFIVSLAENWGADSASPGSLIEPTLRQAVAQHRGGELQAAEAGYRGVLLFEPNHPVANHNLGLLLVQMNQPEAALDHLSAALDADPANGQFWMSYIDALFQAGQLDAAREVLALVRQSGLQGDEVEALARRLDGSAPAEEQLAPAVQSAQPRGGQPGRQEVEALMVCFSAGRYAEAAAQAQAMAECFPQHEFGWKALGAAFKQMGRPADALEPMRKAADLSPEDVEAHYNLGVTLQELGRLDEAASSYRRAVQINADYADAHGNLGVVLQALGRVNEAEASYRRALRIRPGNVAVLSNLGVLLHDAGRLADAEASFRQALQADPANAEAHGNLGNTLLEMGRLDEAEACYRRALQLKPDNADNCYNLGNVLKDMFRKGDAEASYRRAIQLNPAHAMAYCNLGALLHDAGRMDEAEAFYRRALEINPQSAEAYKNLGANLENQGRFDEAKASYRKAAALGLAGARVQEALMLPAIMGTKEEVLSSRAAYERNLDQLIADHVTIDDPLRELGEANFYLAFQGMDDRDLQIKLAKFYEQACPSLLYTAPHCLKPRAAAADKIRVGFISRFFSSHSVSVCFSKIIEIMSQKQQFEVSLISHHPIDDKIYSAATGRRVLLPNHLARARAMLAELELDVLVYLDIGMEPLSYFLAFSRLARVQCVLGGHPVTTGIGNMDYFLSAAVMESEDADRHYSEKLIRLPRPLVYFERPRLPAELKSRAELGLPEARRVYMCPMKLQKLHPDFDEAIVGILQADREGVVVLFEDDTWAYWKEALLRRFEKTIPENLRARIMFLPWLKSAADFMSTVAAADVLLDPFHFGIGSTAATSCITGTPLVTLTDEFMRGRVGTGYCRMLDVPECITEDTASYVRKAVEIAGNPALRREISAKILKNNGVLYENEQPITDFIGFIAAVLPNVMPVTQPSGVQQLEQMLVSAVTLHTAGESEAAEQLYRQVLQLSPGHPKANHNLGVLFLQKQAPAAGLPYFAAALEADPAHGQFWISYIDALHQAGQTAVACEVLALAKQHGLQGDEVESLATKLHGHTAQIGNEKELVVEDVVFVDSVFPMKVPYSFRNAEVNGLFEQLPSLRSYAMFPMMPGKMAWFSHGYGVDEKTFFENKAGYLKHYPAYEDRVKYLYPDREYKFNLAYTLFLAETYTALPFFEKHRIPFVFELYPGGAFGLNNPSSDAMLSAVFGSQCFRKVITTQKVTYDYLLSKKLCPAEKIEHIFGGILQFSGDEKFAKQYYRKDKSTFDICFVAAKYTPKGKDKGYDLFIEAAKCLAGKHADMRFHVIGGFDENEVDVSDIKDRIHFYGFRQPEWLGEFYPTMDICLSPNRPFQKYIGDFDGYPMGCEQSLFGVAMFTTDPLGNNDGLYDKDEIVLFEPELEDIVRNVEYYFSNLDELYQLAEKGRMKTGRLFNTHDRLRKIAEVLKSTADAA